MLQPVLWLFCDPLTYDAMARISKPLGRGYRRQDSLGLSEVILSHRRIMQTAGAHRLPVPLAGDLAYDAHFIVTHAGWLLFEIVAGRKRRSADPKKARDRGSFRFLIAMIWAGLALAFTFCFGLPQAAIPWMRSELFFVGIALMWAGIGFRYYAMRVLGRYFTFQVDVHSGQTVIEAGPYRYIPHPSYTGALITVIGLGLALGNWASIVALLACISVGYAYRIHVEEAALVGALGQPYLEYMSRTARLVPFVL